MASAAVQYEFDLFFQNLASRKRGALLLDYDGTLAPFRTDRQHAPPYPEVAELLNAIMESTRTLVALVTGRPAMELANMVRMDPAPEIWGSNGLERLRPDGWYDVTEVPLDTLRLLARVDQRLKQEGLGSRVELKPGATAVHWRGLTPQQVTEVRRRTLRVWKDLQPQSLLLLAEFDGGLEFRQRVRNKGDAVRQILAALDPDTPVAYLGDDWTDEDAFRALHNRGLSVLINPEFHNTAADLWLRPPEGVVRFLGDWLLASGGEA